MMMMMMMLIIRSHFGSSVTGLVSSPCTVAHLQDGCGFPSSDGGIWLLSLDYVSHWNFASVEMGRSVYQQLTQGNEWEALTPSLRR
eukprot:10694877-Karenia_brevis.AAC.1